MTCYRLEKQDLRELLERNLSDREFEFELKHICESLAMRPGNLPGRGVELFDDPEPEVLSVDEVFKKYGDEVAEHLEYQNDAVKTEYIESFWEEFFDAERLMKEYGNKIYGYFEDMGESERQEIAERIFPEMKNAGWFVAEKEDELVELVQGDPELMEKMLTVEM